MGASWCAPPSMAMSSSICSSSPPPPPLPPPAAAASKSRISGSASALKLKVAADEGESWWMGGQAGTGVQERGVWRERRPRPASSQPTPPAHPWRGLCHPAPPAPPCRQLTAAALPAAAHSAPGWRQSLWAPAPPRSCPSAPPAPPPAAGCGAAPPSGARRPAAAAPPAGKCRKAIREKGAGPGRLAQPRHRLAAQARRALHPSYTTALGSKCNAARRRDIGGAAAARPGVRAFSGSPSPAPNTVATSLSSSTESAQPCEGQAGSVLSAASAPTTAAGQLRGAATRAGRAGRSPRRSAGGAAGVCILPPGRAAGYSAPPPWQRRGRPILQRRRWG